MSVEISHGRLPLSSLDRRNLPDQTAAGGSAVEALAGLAAAVLAILGLSGIQPDYMASIAAMAVGVSFLFERGQVVAQVLRLLHSTTLLGDGGSETKLSLASAGFAVALVVGVIVIALGIGKALDLGDLRLIGIAAILSGATLVLSLSSPSYLSAFRSSFADRAALQLLAEVAIGIQAVGGIAVLTLGVLVAAGLNQLSLSLIAMLVAGTSQLLSGSAWISSITTHALGAGSGRRS